MVFEPLSVVRPPCDTLGELAQTASTYTLSNSHTVAGYGEYTHVYTNLSAAVFTVSDEN